MEVLGVGLPELAFIVLIALILLGPKDMKAAGRTLGSAYRKFLMSPAWRAMRLSREEFEQVSTKLAREAGLEELKAMEKEVQTMGKGMQADVLGVVNQIKPKGFGRPFNERQVFSSFSPTPSDAPKPSLPSNEPETPSEPPAAPDA